MDLYKTAGLGQGTSTTPRPMSRIDNDVQRITMLIERLNGSTERIMRHGHSLGYYMSEKNTTDAAVGPVVTTLSQALDSLEAAIDRNSGALNVFD